jgi:hypothetical protein
MTFVYQSGSVVLESVAVRSIRADRHGYHRVITTQPKVHPALKTCTLSGAHLNMCELPLAALAHRN